MKWYVGQAVTAQSDKHVLASLKRAGIETYYPMIRRLEIAPKRRQSPHERKLSAAGIDVMKVVIRPLFSRYYFVHMDIASPWREAFSFAGISGLVCKHGLPAEIHDDLIAALQGVEVAGVIPGELPVIEAFALGERVRITEGAFVGFDGIVEDVKRKRIGDLDAVVGLRLAVEIFGRVSAMTLDATQVERIEAH